MNLTIELDNPIGFAYVRDEQLKMICFRTDDDDDLELVKEFVEDAKGFETIEDMGSKWKIDRFVLIRKSVLVDVNVKFIEYYDKHNEMLQYTFSTNYTKGGIDAGNHLAKCLEDYLKKNY